MNGSKLPKNGNATKIPWPSDFFPGFKDGVNVNDKGESESATSKYAKAFNLDPTALQNNVSASSGIDRQAPLGRNCTQDADCTQYKDFSVCAKRRGKTAGFCIPTWFGLCHAWFAYH